MLKNIHNCLLITQNNHPDEHIRNEAKILLEQKNTSAGSILLKKEIYCFLEKVSDFINKQEFDFNYSQAIAIFLKYGKNNLTDFDNKTLDDVLMGGDIPSHLVVYYENEALAIRKTVIDLNEMEKVYAIASSYGFNPTPQYSE